MEHPKSEYPMLRAYLAHHRARETDEKLKSACGLSDYFFKLLDGNFDRTVNPSSHPFHVSTQELRSLANYLGIDENYLY